MRYLDRLVHWWRYLAWFDVRRARDWQAVIICGVLTVCLLAWYAATH